MDTNGHNIEHEGINNPGVDYERRDLGARNIILFFVVLAISGIAVHFLVLGLYKVFAYEAVKLDPEQNPMVAVETVPQPGVMQNTRGVNIQEFPTLRLQSDDATDLDKFRWQERQVLNAAPWRDENGVVHVSIDRGMQLVLQRGLPSRNSAVPESRQDAEGLVTGPLGMHQAPMGQTESGNRALSNTQEATDATSVPGAESKKPQ